MELLLVSEVDPEPVPVFEFSSVYEVGSSARSSFSAPAVPPLEVLQLTKQREPASPVPHPANMEEAITIAHDFKKSLTSINVSLNW